MILETQKGIEGLAKDRDRVAGLNDRLCKENLRLKDSIGKLEREKGWFVRYMSAQLVKDRDRVDVENVELRAKAAQLQGDLDKCVEERDKAKDSLGKSAAEIGKLEKDFFDMESGWRVLRAENADLRKASKPLVWKPGPPRDPGWFWVEDRGGVRWCLRAYVDDFGEQCLTYISARDRVYSRLAVHKHAGPIPEPVEEKADTKTPKTPEPPEDEELLVEELLKKTYTAKPWASVEEIMKRAGLDPEACQVSLVHAGAAGGSSGFWVVSDEINSGSCALKHWPERGWMFSPIGSWSLSAMATARKIAQAMNEIDAERSEQ